MSTGIYKIGTAGSSYQIAALNEFASIDKERNRMKRYLREAKRFMKRL